MGRLQKSLKYNNANAVNQKKKLTEKECLRKWKKHQDNEGFMFGTCTRCGAFLG